MAETTDDRIERLLSELTLEEKVSLLAGEDMWHAPGVPRLGIPRLKLSDGPIGVRGASLAGETTSACFPCGSALGATWSPELIEQVGAALGDEAHSKGAHVVLAPTVNVHRSPLAGRNFECYSEDPHLAGRLAAAMVRGVQSRGVGATVKHFVCNDSEFERHTISSEVGERALREIYLPPFEAAVREAGVAAVMSAYNKLNGTFASENGWLLSRLLRQEWSFEGFVVSDWFGTHSTAEALRAGLDLEMPGPPRHRGEKLVEAVRAGRADEKTVDASVRRLLRARARTGAWGTPEAFEAPAERAEQAVDRPEHRRLARRAAIESTVLLKNEQGALPLDAARPGRLAVIGPNADAAHVQGGGSARVSPHYTVTPLAGIAARCGEQVEVVFEPGCASHRSIPPLDARWLEDTETGRDAGGGRGFRVEVFDNPELAGPPAVVHRTERIFFTWHGRVAPGIDPARFSARCTGRFVPPRTGTYTFALASAGKSRLSVDGTVRIDNWTRQERGSSFYGAGSTEVTAGVELTAGRPCEIAIEYTREGARRIAGLRAGCLAPLPPDALERAVACAAGAGAAVVVAGLDADWETEGRDRADMELPGRQAELIERVAAANARTIVLVNAGSPVRADWIDRVPAAVVFWYPGQEGGRALADVLFGDADPSGRLPQTWPRRIEDSPAFLSYPGERGRVVYGEGIFVGYRYYDTKRVEPRFPFGHGLSYASFAYGALEADAARVGPDDAITVSIDVTNTSARRGQEVVQLYARDPEASVARPEKELVAFRKIELGPGETQRVSFELDARALAFWDPERSAWLAEAGAYELLAGRSSRDIRARAEIVLLGEAVRR